MIAPLIEQLPKELGEDVKREGLDRTPDRVEKALRYLTSGYGQEMPCEETRQVGWIRRRWKDQGGEDIGVKQKANNKDDDGGDSSKEDPQCRNRKRM